MKNPLTKPNAKITQFLDLVRQGIEAWVKAGELLILMLEDDPDVFDKIVAQSDGLKHEHLVTFERIGRKELYPRLLLDESYAAKRILDLGLPIEKQVELYEKPIPVAVAKNGGVVTELKRLHELNRNEAHIVLGESGARGTEEQARMILERKAKEHVRYRIDGEAITFYAHSTFTRAQLEDLISRLKPITAESIQGAITKNQIRAAA